MEVVAYHYKDPAEFMRPLPGGGWEVLSQNLNLSIDELIWQDIQKSINTDKAWGDENEYFNDESDLLNYHWQYFVDVAKHRARYLFGNTNDLRSSSYRLKPYDIFKSIARIVEKYGLIKTLTAGTLIYRCRLHANSEKLINEADFYSPPSHLAIQANRMSPVGISMFYGAFDHKSCLAETLTNGDKSLTHYSIGAYHIRQDLQIVDLSSIPPITSLFDKAKWEDFHSIVFLHDFVDNLVKPISRDAKIHLEYVPTQIVTEYFRYARSKKKIRIKVDGIIYPSSKNPGLNACVLFFDHEECEAQFQFKPKETIRKLL